MMEIDGHKLATLTLRDLSRAEEMVVSERRSQFAGDMRRAGLQGRELEGVLLAFERTLSAFSLRPELKEPNARFVELLVWLSLHKAEPTITREQAGELVKADGPISEWVRATLGLGEGKG